MDNPIEFVAQMGWEHRISNTQIEVKVCPFCHADDWLFRMNKYTGRWDCKHLNRHEGKNTKGNLHTLRKALGLTLDMQGQQNTVYPLGFVEHQLVEQAHQRLLDAPAMLQIICDEWAITEDTVRKWKLGYRQDNSGAEYIVIPHYVKGEVCNVKFRTWFGHPKAFHRVSGASSVLFNEDVLYAAPKVVTLCEGEKDAILADLAGVENPVGMTGGAATLLERWYNLLEPVELIYIAYDGDVAGEEGVDRLIKRLGSHRVRVVPIPSKQDVADIVKNEGQERIRELVGMAKEPTMSSIRSAADITKELILAPVKQPIPTPWANVNRVLGGGTYPAQVIVVVAPPKIGKTTTCLAWMLGESMRRGVPSCLWCLEMPDTDLTEMLVGMVLGVGRTPSKADYFIYNRAYAGKIPFYFGYDPNTDVETMTQTFKDAHDRFGVELFAFDNVHFAVRNESDSSSKVMAMEKWMKAFKTLAMALKIRIIPIAQPKKLDPKKGADITYYDIGWSASFASDADTIIVLHRQRVIEDENSFRPEMMFKVDAGRTTKGGTTYLYYRGETMQFRNMTKGEVKSLITSKHK